MFEIKGHETKGADGHVTIRVLDEKGQGGAYHEYEVTSGDETCLIKFQNGPIAESGVNGLSLEALLTIGRHRLECFQEGDYPSEYNKTALYHIESARYALNQRTIDKLARNVEGKSEA